MLLFSRIFDFQRKDIQQEVEQRLNRRYVPGKLFPLRAYLRGGVREVPARIHDLSTKGLALVVDAAHAPGAGQEVALRLKLDAHELDLRGKVAHVKPGLGGVRCGIGLIFDDFALLKPYLQLLQPVALASTLEPIDQARVQQNEPQFIKQVFRGEGDSVLSLWLAKSAGTPLHSFEFRMHGYFVRADAATAVLEVFRENTETTHKGKLTTPELDATSDAADEIRQLFRWAVPNLPATIPDDARVFLQRMAG